MPDVSAPLAPPPPRPVTGTAETSPGAAEQTTAEHTAAQRAFSTAILISATRCLLTYVLLPFVAPAVGLAGGVGPALGLVISVIAIVANGFTVRRFHRANHRYRWAYTVVAGAVIVLLLSLMVQDVAQLL